VNIPALFGPLYDAVAPALDAGNNKLVEVYIGWVQEWLPIAFGVVTVWHGATLLRGNGRISDYWALAFRAALLIALTQNVATYNEWVREPIQGLADELGRATARAMGNGNAGSGAQPFDAVMKDALLMGLRVWQTLGWTDLGPMLVVGCFWLLCLVTVGFSFVLWFGTTIFLKILLAVGVIFFGFAIFETTRAKLFRWLDACAFRIALMTLSFIFSQALLTAEGVLLTQFVSGQSGAISRIIGTVLGCGVFLVFLKLAQELPQLAHDMTGGSGAHNTSGAAAATFGFAGGLAAASFRQSARAAAYLRRLGSAPPAGTP